MCKQFIVIWATQSMDPTTPQPKPTNRPIAVHLPESGILVSESLHGAGFKMDQEQHDFHECYAVFRGTIALNDERFDSPIEMSAGTFCAIPAGVSHKIEDHTEAAILLLCFSEAFIQQHKERATLWTQITQRAHPLMSPSGVHASNLHDALRRIMNDQSADLVGARLSIESEVNQTLLGFARMPDSPPGQNAEERVAEVIRNMGESFFEPWDIDLAANQAHLSRRRFTELFKAQTGTTFNETLTKFRLEHAARLLTEGNSTIPGAAFACGINDLSHFYRLFSKRFGMPPGKWVKQ